MEISREGSCFFLDRMYPSGDEVHGYIRDLVCNDGRWNDPEGEFADSDLSLAYVYH
jgi:hypothetical protein